jgi:hypothetical protein
MSLRETAAATSALEIILRREASDRRCARAVSSWMKTVFTRCDVVSFSRLLREGKEEKRHNVLWHAFSKRTVTSLEIIWFCVGLRSQCVSVHAVRTIRLRFLRLPHLQFGIHLCDFFDPRERQRLMLEIVRVVFCDVHRVLPEPVRTWIRVSSCLPPSRWGGRSQEYGGKD